LFNPSAIKVDCRLKDFIMTPRTTAIVNKIAEITLLFWVLKIIATTLGETFGDFVAQTLGLGYVVGLAVTTTFLALMLALQIGSKTFHPALFWGAIVATTTMGTEVSDLIDRTFGLGYMGGTAILAGLLFASLFVWHRRIGHLSVHPIANKDVEILFWVTVLFSNSLGTAFGDFLVDVVGLGYFYAAIVTTAVILAVLVLHYKHLMNEVALFWIAFVFTRPFGATFGDFLTKPLPKGGLDLGTLNASMMCLVLMSVMVFANLKLRQPVAVNKVFRRN
jgi:uncharacterized membrane-anchored protein